MNAWTLAILPLIGVVLGAGLQFLLTRATAREQQTTTLRFQAYADYLRAVAMAGHLRSDEDLRGAHRDAADAKARIAVYGTVDVIKAMARFEEFGAVLSDGPASRAFVSLVSAMRPKSGDVSEHELDFSCWEHRLIRPCTEARTQT
ncbi:MAG TPA: hypothetical protein VKB05_17385 [Pyrinomonadaceae bacterium]|nr:hypothetical protein [Pyrinomonadaceae bacterium]